ncbi:hypothetical protein BDL97_07G021100, partial [Sphagnum fallax]
WVILLAMANSGHEFGVFGQPKLPSSYGGMTGNTLMNMTATSWPQAQGPLATFTFFAPANSALEKFPCLFLGTGSLSATVAVSVLQYHIIPNRVYTYDQLKQLADTADFMATTAFGGQTLNVSTGTFKLNGYAKIDKPDIYQSYARQKIHGIDSMLIPPGMQIGCGPYAPIVKPVTETQSASDPACK